MCFQEGGHSQNLKFYSNSEKIDVVSEYTYLGVTFTSNSLFSVMSRSTVAKAKQVAGAVISLIVRSKTVQWSGKITLYESLVLGMIQHCLPIWGIRYLEILEHLQVSSKDCCVYHKVPLTTLLGWKRDVRIWLF